MTRLHNLTFAVSVALIAATLFTAGPAAAQGCTPSCGGAPGGSPTPPGGGGSPTPPTGGGTSGGGTITVQTPESTATVSSTTVAAEPFVPSRPDKVNVVYVDLPEGGHVIGGTAQPVVVKSPADVAKAAEAAASPEAAKTVVQTLTAADLFASKVIATATGTKASQMAGGIFTKSAIETVTLYLDLGVTTPENLIAFANYIDRLPPGKTTAAELLKDGFNVDDSKVVSVFALLPMFTNNIMLKRENDELYLEVTK